MLEGRGAEGQRSLMVILNYVGYSRGGNILTMGVSHMCSEEDSSYCIHIIFLYIPMELSTMGINLHLEV